MNTCYKCAAHIDYGDSYFSIDYLIESTNQDAHGNLSVQVISSENLLVLCQSCGEKHNSKTTQKLIKRMVSQDGSAN